jgi:hypothetical protein
LVKEEREMRATAAAALRPDEDVDSQSSFGEHYVPREHGRVYVHD